MKYTLILGLLFFACCKKRSDSGDNSAAPAKVGTEAEAGKDITVSLGQPIVIRLASQTTAGNVWYSKSDDGLGAPTTSHDLSACAPRAVGCSGDEVFTFSTTSASVRTYILSFEQRRFDDSVVNTYSVKVAVTK